MSTSAKPNRSNRRGQARSKIRENSSAIPEIIPGVRREIPTYDLLGDEQLDLIEQNAARILKEVGVEFRGDADALELVMLGHYLGPYDDYFYAKTVDSGDKSASPPTDIHSVNQRATGLATRDLAKTLNKRKNPHKVKSSGVAI